VIIPASNVSHLMLRRDVVDAVVGGQFHVHAIATVDEGIALLTGLPAGGPQEGGGYPEGSFNARVLDRLRALAERRREFAGPPPAGPGDAH
jgi:predicted ATP-dependent protease